MLSRTNLLPIAQKIAQLAFRMGGSPVLWQKKVQCTNKRPNGDPCKDPYGSGIWETCPVCGGMGYVFDKGELFLGIYTDNSNQMIPDMAGGVIKGKKELSIPYNVYTRLFKDYGGSTRELGRDRFTILTRDGRPLIAVYPVEEATTPFVSGGVIYRILHVETFGGTIQEGGVFE